MKKLIYSLTFISLVLTSFQSEETSDTNNSDITSETIAVNTSKFEKLVVEPCNLLTKER